MAKHFEVTGEQEFPHPPEEIRNAFTAGNAGAQAASIFTTTTTQAVAR